MGLRRRKTCIYLFLNGSPLDTQIRERSSPRRCVISVLNNHHGEAKPVVTIYGLAKLTFLKKTVHMAVSKMGWLNRSYISYQKKLISRDKLQLLYPVAKACICCSVKAGRSTLGKVIFQNVSS